YPDVATSQLGALDHYLAVGLAAGRAPNAVLHALHAAADAGPDGAGGTIRVGDGHDDRAAQLDAALLMTTGAFDAEYYLANNPDVARAHADPLLHFCRHGWKELRNPSPDF